MKKLFAILAVFVCALAVNAQDVNIGVNNPPFPGCTSNGSGGITCTGNVTGAATPSTLYRLTAPVSNTGATSEVTVITASKIPAGTMTATGNVKVEMRLGACTANVTPFSSCTAANTGTCTARVYLGTTSGAKTSQLISGYPVTAAHHASFTATVQNQNSTSAQQLDGIAISGSGSQDPFSPPPLQTAFNTANDVFVTVTMQNSVSGDLCWIDQLNITNWP